MLVVIDIGNTRTKWAQVKEDGRLHVMQATLNTDIATSPLKEALLNADKVMVANVAGEAVTEELLAVMPSNTEVNFATVQPKACNVINHYNTGALGIDRWAAVVGAWHLHTQPTIVVNAGTAITIDALSRDKGTKEGHYLGGIIMPGLRLMHDALTANTAQLPSAVVGELSIFPDNTQDAIQSGCMKAIVGAVVLQLKQLEKHCAFLPKVVISGGDAVRIADGLNRELKRSEVVGNLVLQGLVLLEKETV